MLFAVQMVNIAPTAIKVFIFRVIGFNTFMVEFIWVNILILITIKIYHCVLK
jgi:hypothetical protein